MRRRRIFAPSPPPNIRGFAALRRSSPRRRLPRRSLPKNMELQSITTDTCIIRDTASQKGRTLAIAPGKAGAARHLRYGRIILDAGDNLSLSCDGNETGLICLNGTATIAVEGASYTLGRYDALYLHRD